MSRRIIGAAFISLDGVMQAPGGAEEDRSGGFAHGGWLAPLSDEAVAGQIRALFSAPFDLLLGRRTYEIFAAYWPFVSPDHPIAARFAAARKFVLGPADLALTWDGSERLADLNAVGALKAESGPDLIVQGSATLYPQLLAEGLLDRLILIQAPVLLGTGKRLFGEGTPATTLRLIEQRSGANGMRVATFEPAGPVATAPSGPEQANPRELARRERIARGTW